MVVCEDPSDTEHCKLMYMDSDGKYICVNECPSGLDKDINSNMCIPDLKHDKKVITVVVMLIISLVSVVITVSIVLALHFEKKQQSSRFLAGKKQLNSNRSV